MSVTHVRESLQSLGLPTNLNVQELTLDTYSHHINYVFLDSVRLASPPFLRHLQYEMFDDHENREIPCVSRLSVRNGIHLGDLDS